MSDQRDGVKPKDGVEDGAERGPSGGEAGPHKVDEAAQEKAGQERADNEGYD